MDFWISGWISGFQSGFLDFTVDFWISVWISGFHSGFLDFSLDFWISVWISADGVRDFFRDRPLSQLCLLVNAQFRVHTSLAPRPMTMHGLWSGNKTAYVHAYKIRKWRPSQRTAAGECCGQFYQPG